MVQHHILRLLLYRRYTMKRPPRSSHLIPLDILLWCYLKSRIYRSNSENLDELRSSIIQETALLPGEMIRNAV